MFSIFTYVMSRVTHSEPGLPMGSRAKILMAKPNESDIPLLICCYQNMLLNYKPFSSTVKIAELKLKDQLLCQFYVFYDLARHKSPSD